MKPSSLLVLLLGLIQAYGQGADDLGISVEIISLEAQAAFALAAKDHESPARAALEPLLANGSAKIEELAYAFTRLGTQVSPASTVSIIYPTEYDPPETFQEIVGPITKEDQLRTPATPTAFQTREVGLRLEVVASRTANPQVIEVELNLDQTDHVGDDLQGQHESQLTWPRFHSKALRGKHLLKNGQDTLLGLLSPKEANSPQRLLAFVRATYLPLNTQAVDDPAKGPRNVEVLVESISIRAKAIPKLLREHVTADASLVRQSVATMIEAGEAEVLDSAFMINWDSIPTRTRSGNERIYSVEFDPPAMPQTIQGIHPDLRVATPAFSTTAEMRPEGFQIEGSANWDPTNDTIILNIRPERTTLVGKRTCGQGLSEVKLPIFATQKVTTNVTVPNGGYALLGLFSDRAIDGSNRHRYTLTFARALARQP